MPGAGEEKAAGEEEPILSGPRPLASGPLFMILYAFTIVVSAFLLFQVQPVIAKIILPWFGGSGAVWTTCMFFFQLVLLLGYMYAHAVIRYLKPRMQMVVHTVVLASSAVVLPVYPNLAWKPAGGEETTLRILGHGG